MPTVFSMPYWKKAATNINATVFFRLLFILCFLISPAALGQSPEIHFEDIKYKVHGSALSIDVQINYKLSPEIQDALDHGVPIEIDTRFRITQKRHWIWDKVIATKRLEYRIDHRPLSGHYLISSLQTGELYQFRDLNDGLQWMGKIENMDLLESKKLDAGHQYQLQIKSGLNVKSLPAPLRPLAYLSSAWRLNSDWVNKDIKL